VTLPALLTRSSDHAADVAFDKACRFSLRVSPGTHLQLSCFLTAWNRPACCIRRYLQQISGYKVGVSTYVRRRCKLGDCVELSIIWLSSMLTPYRAPRNVCSLKATSRLRVRSHASTALADRPAHYCVSCFGWHALDWVLSLCARQS
jgi:hypothetical protein